MTSEQTKQLTAESQRMEERLRTLKEMMKKEKEKRESNCGVFWQSGQRGAVLKYTDTAATKSTTPLKSRSVKIQVLTDKNVNTKSIDSPSRKKAKYCGECGKKAQSLTRTKAGMPICKECHLKFTPAKSHSTDIGKLDSSAKLDSLTATISDGNISRSLLEGTYDEEANAASFAEALTEWRSGSNSVSKAQEKTTTGVCGNSASCQTVTSEKQTAIDFSNGGLVTYLERLMIRRNRYDPRFLKNTVTTKNLSHPVSPVAVEDELSVDTVVPSQYNVFYEACYSQEADSIDSVCISTVNTETNCTNRLVTSVQPSAMQAAIKEAWTSKENTGNLSHFFLSGLQEKTTTGSSECHNSEVTISNIATNYTTGTWNPIESISVNCSLSKPQDDEVGDSDASDNPLDLADCESGDEEWEMDDRMTLECLERELQASQMSSNPENGYLNYSNDFEEDKQQ